MVIDAGGKGTVLTVRADHVTLRGLTLRGSGDSHDALDGGLMAEGHNLLIEDNVIEDVLFGIALHKVTDSVVRANRIRSRPVDPADRGDGLRLWYSRGNRIEGNDIAQIRDVTVSNSPLNRFTIRSRPIIGASVALSGPCAWPVIIIRSGMNRALPLAPVASFTAAIQTGHSVSSIVSGLSRRGPPGSNARTSAIMSAMVVTRPPPPDSRGTGPR